MTDHRILLVDADEGVLRAASREAEELGLTAVCATGAREALERVAEQSFAVAVVDPDQSGAEAAGLLVALRERAPQMVRVVLTGSADIHRAQAAINEGAAHRYLLKPLRGDDLRREIRQAVEHHVLAVESGRLHGLAAKMNDALKHHNRGLDKRVRELSGEVHDLGLEIRSNTAAAVDAIAAMADAHSAGLGEHGRRVAELCASVGRRLGLDSDELRDLDLAARLHDVGKVGLSTQALHLPEGYLRPAELEVLRRHAARGQAVLAHLAGAGQAPAIVRHHHERWDGLGYPDRLTGGSIPIGARILSACDQLDERTHPMDETQPMDIAAALSDLLEETPARFDPRVLRALAQHLEVRLAA